jgi:hypothetical protein
MVDALVAELQVVNMTTLPTQIGKTGGGKWFALGALRALIYLS